MAETTLPEFDSSAYDSLKGRLQELQGLANCATVLGECEAGASGISAELIDIALPSLGRVMNRLAEEAEKCAEALWDQNEKLRGALEGGQS